MSDSAWAGSLAALKPLSDGFLEWARPLSLIGRIPGLRRVPFNCSFPTVTAPSIADWVGENAPKPVSSLSLATTTLTTAKVADTVVITDELMRLSQPNAETVVRDDLAGQVNAFVDRQFVDPAKAAVANTSPGSITNGITPITPSGTTTAALKADLGTLIAQFATNNPDITTGVLLLPPTAATMLTLSMSQPTFTIAGGGSYAGFSVVVSGSMGTAIVLVDAHAIAIADEGVEIDMSREAMLEMNTTPTNPPVAATAFVSLWQMNLVGVRAERFTTWKRARTSAVSLISPTAYVPGT
jgi:HK97 family phage major capsid protein